MEDTLEVYHRPYDKKFPMVCFDETNRQLIAETRKAIPARPGRNRRIDYEYRRNGVVNLFMMFEPLKARRHVKVMDRRTRKDFAQCIRELVDVHYADAEKIVLVLDNLNTHSEGSLYEAFEPAEARRLAEKLEIHYTPKHGSWLNMAEIEIGVLSRQCLSKYIENKERMVAEVAAWEQQRNEAEATVDWQFATVDARVKLKTLYPAIQV
jgi:hypothetical protein